MLTNTQDQESDSVFKVLLQQQGVCSQAAETTKHLSVATEKEMMWETEPSAME